MNKKFANELAKRVSTFYDLSVPIEGLKDLLRNITYTCFGHTAEEVDLPAPLLKITIEESDIIVLPNPYYVRYHLKEKGLEGWSRIISTVKQFYCMTGRISFHGSPSHTKLHIHPSYLIPGEVYTCGEISIVIED